jgi:hypothetical protein
VPTKLTFPELLTQDTGIYHNSDSNFNMEGSAIKNLFFLTEAFEEMQQMI